MKVLTIRQPWASLIMSGDKSFEFRTWKTNFRGELLIHAGKGIDKLHEERLKKYLPDNLPLGQIIGKVNITDCIEFTPELKEKLLKENPDVYKYSEVGCYAWKIENVEILDKPIAISGRLGLWNFEYVK